MAPSFLGSMFFGRRILGFQVPSVLPLGSRIFCSPRTCRCSRTSWKASCGIGRRGFVSKEKIRNIPNMEIQDRNEENTFWLINTCNNTLGFLCLQKVGTCWNFESLIGTRNGQIPNPSGLELPFLGLKLATRNSPFLLLLTKEQDFVSEHWGFLWDISVELQQLSHGFIKGELLLISPEVCNHPFVLVKGQNFRLVGGYFLWRLTLSWGLFYSTTGISKPCVLLVTFAPCNRYFRPLKWHQSL